MPPSTLADMISDREIRTAQSQDSVRTACITMSSGNIGALPVVDGRNFLIGMISERDIIKRSVIVYRPSQETTVGQIMTKDPKWLPPEAHPNDAIELMRSGRFRHVPICVEGVLTGIVSIRDFVFLAFGDDSSPTSFQERVSKLAG